MPCSTSSSRPRGATRNEARASSAAAAAISRCGNPAPFSRRCAPPRPRPRGRRRSPSSPRAAISISRRCWSARWRKGSSRASSNSRCSTAASTSWCIRSRICPRPSPRGSSNRTILPRATAADWLLVRREFYAERDDGLLPLAAGTRVGASSLRRGALLGRFAPQAVSVPLRGNVPTRLRKLGEGADRRCHRAGGRRAHAPAARPVGVRGGRAAARVVDSRARPGRAGRAMPCRRSARSKTQIALLADADCVRATRWEREFLRVIEGGCSTPFGCFVAGGRAHLGIATERGWAAHSIDLPKDLLEDSQRDSFIRGAVAGCQPDRLSETAARALGRALRAR